MSKHYICDKCGKDMGNVCDGLLTIYINFNNNETTRHPQICHDCARRLELAVRKFTREFFEEE